MGKKHSLETFIKAAKSKHGDKYNYDKVIYRNNKEYIEIICPIHGSFYQRPDSHLHGKGCAFCGLDTHKTLICGVAVNDIYLAESKHEHAELYNVWKSMIERCYKPPHKRNSYYLQSTVCDEWLKLSGFRDFFDKNYIKGFHLDKDYRVPGNKIYSPSTCLFVPPEINSIIINCGRDKHGKLRGVNYSKKLRKYIANISDRYISHRRIHIGTYETEEQAEQAYISKKREIIKCIADKYKDIMPIETYNIILNYNL